MFISESALTFVQNGILGNTSVNEKNKKNKFFFFFCLIVQFLNFEFFSLENCAEGFLFG